MSNYIGAEPSYGVFDKQILTGDGSTTQFNLDYPVATSSQLLVSLDGVIQEPDYSYTVSSSTGQGAINFSEAPDASGRVFITYMGRQLLQASVTQSESFVDIFNGDGSTVAFTLTRTPVTNDARNFIVFVDNVYQREGSTYAFTVTGQTLTFSGAPASGTNNIQVYQLNNINTLNTIADNTVTSAKIQDGSIARVDLAFDPEDDATALAIALG
jgi:hypothetical protein